MFRVEWIEVAVADLTRIWTQADSPMRHAITVASNAIDQELQTDPFRQSEGRAIDTERILFFYPLAVYFEVDPAARTCQVLGVWRYRRPNP